MSKSLHNRWEQAASVALLALALVFAQPVGALDFAFPGAAEKTASRVGPMSSIRLPVGPFADGNLPTELAEGALDMSAYQLVLDRTTTLELLQSLREQVVAAGFEVVFECETEACGGYDFRYGSEVLPEPDMHVDLGDFRYLLARGPGVNSEALALLVSRSGRTGFVQITRVGGQAAVEAGAAIPLVTPEPIPEPEVDVPEPAAEKTDLVAGLENGRAQVLEDLIFPSGSSALAEGDYSSLKALAAWLKADAGRNVVLVGHTDASGGLDANIRLSQLRAESVRQVLLFAHGVRPEQIQARGIGFLSPRDTNLSEEGRRKNRRVEVLATSTGLLAP